MDLSVYKQTFLQAARDKLVEFETGLNKLKENPNNPEAASELHRHIHSLGSQHYAMGYASTGSFIRIIEAYFYKIKNGEVDFKPEKIQVINEALETIKMSLKNIESSDKEVALESQTKDLETKLNS